MDQRFNHNYSESTAPTASFQDLHKEFFNSSSSASKWMGSFMMNAYKCTQEATDDVTGHRHAFRLLGITKTNSHSTLFGGKFFCLWTNKPVCHFSCHSKHVQGSAISMEGHRFWV